jgi:hypothetical protein
MAVPHATSAHGSPPFGRGRHRRPKAAVRGRQREKCGRRADRGFSQVAPTRVCVVSAHSCCACCVPKGMFRICLSRPVPSRRRKAEEGRGQQQQQQQQQGGTRRTEEDEAQKGREGKGRERRRRKTHVYAMTNASAHAPPHVHSVSSPFSSASDAQRHPASRRGLGSRTAKRPSSPPPVPVPPRTPVSRVSLLPSSSALRLRFSFLCCAVLWLLLLLLPRRPLWVPRPATHAAEDTRNTTSGGRWQYRCLVSKGW